MSRLMSVGRPLYCIALVMALAGGLVSSGLAQDKAAKADAKAPAAAKEAPAPKNPADPRVRALLDELQIKRFGISELGNYVVEFSLEGAETRKQVVFVSSKTDSFDNIEIRRVWSTAYVTDGPLSKDLANRFLMDNIVNKIGAWELSKRDGQYRVMYTVKVPADCSAQMLKVAMRTCMSLADACEKELTKKDEF